tara:strand:- start:216 stop:647 length:432 start_codon:yes stop_codon:yes gene_type:complete
MVKKEVKKNRNHLIHNKIRHHPVLREELNLGQKASDTIAKFGGSWTFIILFGLFLLIWMVINSWLLTRIPFDPYPFILLNLVLSCIASVQAPIILMAQNRQTQRDRIDAKYDHTVNRKAEREIQGILKEIEKIHSKLNEIRRK